MAGVWGTPAVGVRWHARPMVELSNQDLSGSVFDDVDLSGSRFRNVHLEGAAFIGCWATRLDLNGDFDEIVYNGIDLVPLWRAEMVRRHPEFALLRPEDADGYREVWPLLEEPGDPPSPGRAPCPRSCSTSGSTASGPSSRPSATPCSSSTPGCDGRCWPRPRPTTRST